jgi:hypothetical protein
VASGRCGDALHASNQVGRDGDLVDMIHDSDQPEADRLGRLGLLDDAIDELRR